jgi:threonine dehydrogenase-like Zn-dependent dehydrogenase
MTDPYAFTPAGAVRAALGDIQPDVIAPAHPGMTVGEFIAQVPERRALIREFYAAHDLMRDGEPTARAQHMAEITRQHQINATGANWVDVPDANTWEQIQRRIRLGGDAVRVASYAEVYGPADPNPAVTEAQHRMRGVPGA